MLRFRYKCVAVFINLTNGNPVPYIILHTAYACLVFPMMGYDSVDLTLCVKS